MKPDETAALEKRITRLEVALAEVARIVTAQLPLRGKGPGVRAVQELEREVRELEGHAAAQARRDLLEAELAGLGGAA